MLNSTMEDPEQLKRLKSMFDFFINSNPENSINFFVRFLSDNPHLKELFPHLRNLESPNDLRQNEWLRNVHVPRLMASIERIIKNIEDGNVVRSEAIKIFHQPAHIANEVYENEYGLMFRAMLQTIEECAIESGQDFSDEDRTLWVDFATWIYSVFSDRAITEEPPPPPPSQDGSMTKSRSFSSSSNETQTTVTSNSSEGSKQ